MTATTPTTTTTPASGSGAALSASLASGTLWDLGDYSAVGVRIASIAEDLCETADLRGGSDVLDVATGNGNAAMCAARRDARVVGIDIAPGLLDRARARRDSEGLEIRYELGDAEHLSFDHDSFDMLLSCVGVQFAADQPRVAGELLRVCRPGGRIALANWSPHDLWTELPTLMAEYAAPAPAAASPMTWGTESGLRSLFGDGVAIRIEPRTFRYRFASEARYVDMMVRSFPPFVRTLQQLEETARVDFERDLGDLVGRWNEATDGTLVLPLTYVIALVDPSARSQ